VGVWVWKAGWLGLERLPEERVLGCHRRPYLWLFCCLRRLQIGRGRNVGGPLFEEAGLVKP